jgi:UDP-2-acetamido-2,6-beta-L-arabino-hexul-4-ose reductase
VKIVVTGAHGFLGWHLRSALRAAGAHDVVAVGRELDGSDGLDDLVRGCDAVVHIAGVNRADDSELRSTNERLAIALTEALDRTGARPRTVYANSVQAGNGTAYGDGKAAAATHLEDWARSRATTSVDVRLPNLFGEHGRPGYNSFVATFCHALANGDEPAVDVDREVPLLHAQDAADVLIGALETDQTRIDPAGTPRSVSDVLARLTSFRDLYAKAEIPDVDDPFDLALFNTYRSYLFPQMFPFLPVVHADPRGELFECLRAHRGQSQVFCSASVPGAVRGNHFHRRKVERFQVLRGEAVIALRKVLTDEVVEFRVSGDTPSLVDMPTLWSHNITNVGDSELLTLFWTADLLDQASPDTYADDVSPSEAGAVRD